MKKILYKLIELLPFFSVLAVLGFVGYWQIAQYNKIEQLEQQVQQYNLQIQSFITQKSSLNKGLETAQQSTQNLTAMIKQLPNHKRIITDNNLSKEQSDLSLAIKNNPSESSIQPSTPLTTPLTTPSTVLPAVSPISQKIIPYNDAVKQKTYPVEIIKQLNSDADKDKIEPFNDQQLIKQLKQCSNHLKAHRLTRGTGGNAYDCYNSILEKSPGEKLALEGIHQIEKKYIQSIKKYITKNNLPKAQYFLDSLIRINPQNTSIKLLQEKLKNHTPNKILQKKQTIKTSQSPELSANESKKLPHPIKTKKTNEAVAKEIITADPFVQIAAGCFTRNVTIDSKEICIKNSYRISKYEVTQKQWQDIMKDNPSRFINCGDNCPVENVSWFDVQYFIRKLNNKTGKQYRLPTNDEWEYAARAGSNTEFSFGDNPDQLAQYGNYCDKNCINDWNDKKHDDGAKTTAPVGSYKPNAWGLFDLHGNIWEWVADKDSEKHIYRGGSWGDSYELCQSSSRGSAKPDFHVSGIGFRLVQE